MSKTAKELLVEFDLQSEIEDDFRLHVLKVAIDESGEVGQSGNAQPVTKIEIDHENRECLLQFNEATSSYVTISDAKSSLTDDVLEYEVCAAQEKTIDDSYVRIDTPLVGFGENLEFKCFFAVCQA